MSWLVMLKKKMEKSINNIHQTRTPFNKMPIQSMGTLISPRRSFWIDYATSLYKVKYALIRIVLSSIILITTVVGN